MITNNQLFFRVGQVGLEPTRSIKTPVLQTGEHPLAHLTVVVLRVEKVGYDPTP